MYVKLVFAIVLVSQKYSFTAAATNTNQDDTQAQLMRIQILIQGFQSYVSEQINMQKLRFDALENLIDKELKLLHNEMSSMKAGMKAQQGKTSSVGSELKIVQTGVMSFSNEMKTLQTEMSSLNALVHAVQNVTSPLRKDMKVMQSEMLSGRKETTAVKAAVTSMTSELVKFKQAMLSNNQQLNQCCLKTQEHVLQLVKTTTPTPLTKPSVTTQPTPVKQCPGEYKKIGKSCYKIENSSKFPWPKALAECQKEGAHLVTIDTKEENALLASLVRQVCGSNTKLWVGGNDRLKEGEWVWQSTGAKMGYTNWAKGEPNNRFFVLEENCLEVNLKIGSKLQWYDMGCPAQRGYICETELS